MADWLTLFCRAMLVIRFAAIDGRVFAPSWDEAVAAIRRHAGSV